MFSRLLYYFILIFVLQEIYNTAQRPSLIFLKWIETVFYKLKKCGNMHWKSSQCLPPTLTNLWKCFKSYFWPVFTFTPFENGFLIASKCVCYVHFVTKHLFFSSPLRLGGFFTVHIYPLVVCISCFCKYELIVSIITPICKTQVDIAPYVFYGIFFLKVVFLPKGRHNYTQSWKWTIWTLMCGLRNTFIYCLLTQFTMLSIMHKKEAIFKHQSEAPLSTLGQMDWGEIENFSVVGQI